MKNKVLLEVRVTVEPPYSVGMFSATLERKAQRLEEWCREFEDFLRDHRSQDPVSLSVERGYEDQCSFCGRPWEEDADGPLCCGEAQDEWLAKADPELAHAEHNEGMK